MALITCKDCKKEFSTDAKRCPHCGAKKKRPVLFWVLVILIGYLALMNNIAKKPTPPAAAPIQTKTVDSKPNNDWRVIEEHSAMDDSKTIILTKDSENVIDAWLKQVRPTLIIRCFEGKTEVYMDIKGNVQPVAGLYDTHGVEARIDAQKSYMELWKQSSNGEALFAPKPIALAKKLAQSKRVLLKYIPFNVPPVTAEFDTTGLAALLPQVANTCK